MNIIEGIPIPCNAQNITELFSYMEITMRSSASKLIWIARIDHWKICRLPTTPHLTLDYVSYKDEYDYEIELNVIYWCIDLFYCILDSVENRQKQFTNI